MQMDLTDSLNVFFFFFLTYTEAVAAQSLITDTDSHSGADKRG